MNVDKVNKSLRCLGIGYQFRKDKKTKSKQNKEVQRKLKIFDWNIPMFIIDSILLLSLFTYYLWRPQLDFLSYVFPSLGMYSFLIQRVVNNSKNLALSYVLYSLSTVTFLDKQFLPTVIIFIIYLIVRRVSINVLSCLGSSLAKLRELVKDIKPWIVADIITDIVIFSLIALLFQLKNLSIPDNLSTLIAFLLLFFPPGIRVWSGTKNYVSYHGIEKDAGKTFLIVYLGQYLITLVGYIVALNHIFLYLETPKFKNIIFAVLWLYIPTVFTIIVTRSIIRQQGDDIKELVLLGRFMIAMMFIVALLDLLGSDAINLFTWFLPIAFYNVIGGLKDVSDRPVKQGFNRLLYRLTFYTFLGLGIFNIVHISLSETRVVFRDTETHKELRQVQVIKDNHKVEVVVTEENIIKKWIKSKVTEETRNSPVSMKTLDFMISLFQLIVSFLIALFLGLKVEKNLYAKILSNNRYFKEAKPTRNYRLRKK